MGRLLQLELENFKSYGGRQVVGPFDNFTCIIGPNGAGKSNMMDAISFVLGVQSRHLRSNHLKELVFRKDADSAPAKKASVKLTYEVSENELPGKRAGTEVCFCRTISAAGVSAYRIDNRDISYEKYEETLQQIGVLVKARNFLVFQGDVETVASKSPQELTKLLEQISGSDQYIAEYEDLLRRKSEAEENTIFSMQKKKMYSTQCREVKGQKDEAEYFQDKQDELSDLKTEYVLWQIWCVKSEMEGKQDLADQLREQLAVVKANEEELEEEMEGQKRDFAKSSKSLSTAEKAAGSIVSNLEAVTPKLAEARAKLKSLQKRMGEHEKSKGRVQKDLQQQQDTIAGLEGDIAALQEAEAELKEQLESGADSGLKLDAASLKEYSRLREEVSARIAAQGTDEATVGLDLKGKQELLRRMQAQEESQQVEDEACDKLIAECEARHALLRSAITNCTTEQTSLLAAREELGKEMSNSDAMQRTYAAELEGLAEKLRDVGDDRRRGKQEERMNEAISTMQRIFKGVHGRLADLCRPIQRKYSQAVSVAAGKHMDAVVVESKAVAQDCIRYLKDQRVGTCTFLPLDNITVKPLSERVRSFGSKYRPCVDLLECEDAFKGAISYAVGSTLVCDTLEEAQDLCFTRGERVKVVTLRGHSINKSGAMTGGSTASSREGADRWEEKEVDVMRRRKAELEHLLAQLASQAPSRQQLLDLETRVRALQSKVKLNETDLKVVTEKLAHLQQQKALRGETRIRLLKEMEVLSAEVRALEKKLTQMHSSIQAVEAEVFGAFSAKLGISNIRDYEEKSLRKHQDLLQRHNTVAKQCAALVAQLEYEKKRDFQGVLTRLNQQIREAEQEDEALIKLEQNLLREELKIRAQLKEANEKVAGIRAQKDELHQNLKATQIRRTEVLRDKESVSKKLAGEEILIERGRTQLHDILQKAQVDEVALPTVQGGGEDSDDAAGESAGESSHATSVHRSRDRDDLTWEGTQSQSQRRRGGAGGASRHSGAGTSELSSSEGESSGSRATGSTHFSQRNNPTVLRDSKKAAMVDLSSMRKKYKAMTKQRADEIEKGLQTSITELLAELETIQPNMHAAERYEGMVDKLRECSEHLEGTKEAARDLAVRFEEVKKHRQQLFQECYTQVSEALGTIYRDLTRSAKHPVGGNAYLTLDNTDEPYLGGIRFTAMPPMKRFRDMDQLSGGEKTMAALALLFSVHSFRQAPFFVLDEVDAALDNVNVKKICNYIKQRSRDFQCVVISLKEMFYENADCLVGICKDVESLSSEVRTLDLSKYADENPLMGQDPEALAAAGMSSPGPSASRSALGTGSGSRGVGGSGAGGNRVYGRSPQSRDSTFAAPSSAERGGAGEGGAGALGKRKSPIDVRGAVVATKEVLTMGPPAGRSSKAGAVTAARGRSAAARDAIVEETAEDVEDSSS